MGVPTRDDSSLHATMSAKRLSVRVFESSRRFTWSAVLQQALGVSVEGVLIGGLALMGYLEHRQA